MTAHFFAMDRLNYSRWLAVFLTHLHHLESTHPRVHQAFLSGEHSISCSAQTFSQVSTDMALEQSIIADSKAKGGIIGISQTQSWIDGFSQSTNMLQWMELKVTTPPCIKRQQKRGLNEMRMIVNKLVECFTSGLMTNPFSLESDAVVNFATGNVFIPDDVAKTLVNSNKERQRSNFIGKIFQQLLSGMVFQVIRWNLSALCQRTFIWGEGDYSQRWL